MRLTRPRRAWWWLLDHPQWPWMALAALIPLFVAWVTIVMVMGQ